MPAEGKRRRGPVEPPCTMVIFGAAGDLTKRLLVPALYNLARDGLMSDGFRLIGIARAQHDSEAFRAELGQDIRKFATGEFDKHVWDELVERMSYVQGNFDDPAAYKALLQHIKELQPGGTGDIGNVLFYLATAPEYFSPIVDQLAAAGLVQEGPESWRRVIVEKPFGHDLASAKELNAQLLSVLDERQIYRMDHYLGKETVQNMMVFRFANGIFEPLWNRDHIDHVQITVAETVGVEQRGNFYEVTGALRDMVPNHIFQLLSIVAMEVPTSFDADAVRSEKVKVLASVRPITPETILQDTVRGQYGAGLMAEKPVKGYREEDRVSPDSDTQTYVALKLMIDNWRWAGVPFYLRTGKRLPRRMSEICIQFKRAPTAVFRDTPVEEVTPNLLVIRIQPDEGISLQFGAKIPGAELEIGGVKMNFQYKDYFDASPATGYETLIHDCMIGDQTLFQRADNVEAGWRVVQPILDAWAQRRPRGFPNYEAGASGPRSADELLARDGRVWRKI
ncbi:MAG TPA: glucose-6-phosphate dehydrogenase [Aliidongia sp.]|nr:glucose-6-phosphate dehydrogenase [Aliidongia sp.]